MVQKKFDLKGARERVSKYKAGKAPGREKSYVRSLDFILKAMGSH